MANISSLNLSSLYNQLTSFANLSNFWSRFDSVFGTSYDKAIADTLRSQWQTKNFSLLPQIEVVSNRILGNARAAYGTSTNKIYISDSFLTASTTTPSAITAVLLEEIGHFVDAKVNKIDTKGDEGELFSNIVRGVTLSASDLTRIQADNDWGKITLNRQAIAVEQAAPVVYETTKVFSAPGYSNAYYYSQVSGTNAIWTASKGSNYVLNFFDGTTVTPITNSVYSGFDRSDYDISGSTVIYSKNNEIYRYSAGTTTKLTTNAIRDYAPQIDGTNIVWYANDGTDVEIFRNNGTTTTQLTNNTSSEYDLKISGNYTTWVGWDGNDYEIYLNNGTTTTQVTNNTTDDYDPLISGNKLAWRGWNGTTENLFYYNGTTVTQATTNLDVRDFKISGDKVVYTKYDGTNYSLQLYNGTAKTTTQLGSQTYQFDFQVDGNQVAWQEDGGSSSSFDVLKLYNGTSTTTLTTKLIDRFSGPYSNGTYLVAGNKVAYLAVPINITESYNYNSEVFLYDGTSTTQLTEDTLNSGYDIHSISGSNVLWSLGSDLYLSKPSTKIGLSITNSLTVIEGQSSPQNAVLTVSLSAASTTNVTVSYTTEPQSATSGQDYTSTSGTLTFSPGQLTNTITIPILDDNNSESDETFSIKLTNLTGAILIPGQGQATVTITDTLQSSVTASLATTPKIENLTLTGTANINGTGNINSNTITGNSGNNILDGGGISYDTLKGGLGNDTYIVNDGGFGYGSIYENSNEGTDTVQYSSTNTYGGYTLSDYSNLENLTLTGTSDFYGTGNSFNNVITGNSGKNTLDGQAGIDTLLGGLGDDTYRVDTTTDTITELASQGTDTVESSVTFSLAALANVENLTLTGSAAINGTGNAGNNVLQGNSANNILSGGLGNDTYVVNSTGDTVTELAAQGTDTIQSTITFSLETLTNIENLTLIKDYSSSVIANGTGNALNNVITGNNDNNILDGKSGVDTLLGGNGDDTYIVDSTTDTITELQYQGGDTVQSSVTFTLAANVDKLTLTGTANINGTGNADGNTIIGNSGNNILDGGNTSSSFFGTDSLQGGAGNDTYIVSGSSYTTTITENLNEGTDTVQYSSTNSFDSYTLGNNLENLTLTGTIGISGYGNTLNNVITGNSGNNNLQGYAGNDTLNGGTGTDTLTGGSGDDVYQVDSTTDTIYETQGEGTDTIQSSVTFTIASTMGAPYWDNIENLILTGSNAINGTGNLGSNILTGNTANNTLSGDAGNDILTGASGKDTLTGGAGIDKFGYKTLTDSLLANFDVITDFNATTSNDLFLVTTARAGFTNAGAVATLDNAGIIAKLTTTNFAANFAAQFTFGTRSFVAINDATAGFSATTDAIIEVTGLTGTLAATNFVIV